MQLKILLGVFPLFIILSAFLIFISVIKLENIVLGILFIIFSSIIAFALFKCGIHSPQSHFKNITKSTVNSQKLDITFEDGVKTSGIVYRSRSETSETPNGPLYPEPRPTIIFFHGFWASKEANEMLLIPLAHIGYITFAFDQRGHGEAGSKKSEWYKLYNDAVTILDYVCSIKDVKKGAICCIGKSMGGTSVLTKCYEDGRVGMVIAISTLHNIDILLEANFPFLSSGWFVKRIISRFKNKEAFKIAAHYFLKNDLEYNKNRVYLIHGENDKIFPPSLTFELNKKQAQIPDDHALLLDNCGHSFEDQELLVLGIILKWILENKNMSF